MLQKRTGASRADCKAALEAHDGDEEAAAAAVAQNCGVEAGASAGSSAVVGAHQNALDRWLESEQASSVKVERIEAGDGDLTSTIVHVKSHFAAHACSTPLPI